MRIAIPISRFDKSGGIRVLSMLSCGLAHRDHEVTFIVPRGQHIPTFPLDSRVCVHIVEPDMGNIRHVSGLLKKVQLFYGTMETDIAIANAYMTAYSVWLGYKMGRVKYPFYFVQGYEPIAFGEWSRDSAIMKRLKVAAASRTYHLGLNCVANSEWLSGILASKHGIKAVVARLGVDTRIFKPRVETPAHQVLQVMTIGDKNPVKRMDLFAQTLDGLSGEQACTALIATSDHQLRLQCETLVNYYYPNNDYELALIYHQADVFLSTSKIEGFGLPLLEAMACGVPVVTTDSGGIRDFCRDCYNCIIVATDDPVDLISAIARIRENPDLRNRLISNGLITANEWGWEHLADDFDQLFQELPVKRSPYGNH